MPGLWSSIASEVPLSIALQQDLGGCAMATSGTIRIYRPDPASSDERQHCGRAIFAVRRPSSTRTVVAISGAIDAVRSRALGRYVERHTGISRQLVPHLRTID